MARKKAETATEKPRAIMDIISIYDIVGGSYNMGYLLWDYLTQEEQKELLEADKEYKQWRTKVLHEPPEIEETKEKTVIKLPSAEQKPFMDKAKRLYYEARARLWDDIKNDKEKLKKAAAEHITGLDYAAFSFRQTILIMDFLQDRDFGSWSYDENQEEGERFQRSETSPEQLEEKRAKLKDYKPLAESVIDEAINKYETQFIDISEDIEEALKEWTAFIQPYKDRKVKEWVKEATKRQKQLEAQYKDKSLEEITKEVLQKTKTREKLVIPNAKVYNSYADIERLLRIDTDNQMSFIFSPDIQPVTVSGEGKPLVQSFISMGVDTEDGTIPNELKRMGGYETSVYNMTGNLFYAALDQGNRTLIIDIDDLYREIVQDKAAKVTDRPREKLVKCFKKFGARVITINMAQENKKRKPRNLKKDELVKDEIQGRLMDFRIREQRSQKGAKRYIVEVLAEPILFAYARYKGELLTIPKTYWNVLGDLKINDKLIEFREPLIKHLWQIHKGYYNNECIRFNTLLKDAGWTDAEIESQTPKQAFDNRKIIKDLLDAYVKQGLIAKYEDYFETVGKSLVVVGWKITDIPDNALTDEQKAITTTVE